MSDAQHFTPRQLAKELTAAGVVVSAETQKEWLKLTIRTVRAKIKEVAATPGPKAVKIDDVAFKIGDVIDGLSTFATYHVIATRPGKMISAQLFPTGRVKLKFHPTADEWGLTWERLRELQCCDFVARVGPAAPNRVYTRCMVDKTVMGGVLDEIKRQVGLAILTPPNVVLALAGESLKKPAIEVIAPMRLKIVKPVKKAPKKKVARIFKKKRGGYDPA